MALSQTQQQFIQRLMPAAIEASKRTGVDPRIIIAQAAQETGWGRSAPNNNFFGIKSHGQGGGENLQTREFIDGRWVTINDSFRGYESPEDSVRGYADFILENPRYTDFRNAPDLQSQLDALQASGYATDPGYSASVGSIAQSIPLGGWAPPATATAAIDAAAPVMQPRPASGPAMAYSAPQPIMAPARPQQQPQEPLGPTNIMRRAFSNPRFTPQFGTDPEQRRNGVMVRAVSNNGGGLGFLDRPTGRDDKDTARAIRMANSAAIREATGSGAITRQSIAEALSKGARLVTRT